MLLTDEHRQITATVLRFCQQEINPYIAAWEKAQQFPVHEVMAKLGALGLLGIKYPRAYGGMALDFCYAMVMAEALGECHAGAVPQGSWHEKSTRLLALRHQ